MAHGSRGQRPGYRSQGRPHRGRHGRRAFSRQYSDPVGQDPAHITPALRTAGVVIDCAGKVIAPGFIDAHSHLDWHIPIKGHDELKYPFLAQGITTVVAGNCGASAAGFRENSVWKGQAESNLLQERTSQDRVGLGGRLFCAPSLIRCQPQSRPARRARLDPRFHPGQRPVSPASL